MTKIFTSSRQVEGRRETDRNKECPWPRRLRNVWPIGENYIGLVSWYKELTLQESASLPIYVDLFTFERCHRLCLGVVIESNTERYVAITKSVKWFGPFSFPCMLGGAIPGLGQVTHALPCPRLSGELCEPDIGHEGTSRGDLGWLY